MDRQVNPQFKVKRKPLPLPESAAVDDRQAKNPWEQHDEAIRKLQTNLQEYTQDPKNQSPDKLEMKTVSSTLQAFRSGDIHEDTSENRAKLEQVKGRAQELLEQAKGRKQQLIENAKKPSGTKGSLEPTEKSRIDSIESRTPKELQKGLQDLGLSNYEILANEIVNGRGNPIDCELGGKQVYHTSRFSSKLKGGTVFFTYDDDRNHTLPVTIVAIGEHVTGKGTEPNSTYKITEIKTGLLVSSARHPPVVVIGDPNNTLKSEATQGGARASPQPNINNNNNISNDNERILKSGPK